MAPLPPTPSPLFPFLFLSLPLILLPRFYAPRGTVTFSLPKEGQDRFVALSSTKSKAILGALGRFHPERCPRLSRAPGFGASKPRSSQGDGGGTATRPGLTTACVSCCTSSRPSLHAPTGAGGGAHEGLAFVTELLSELLAIRRFVAASAVDAAYYPLSHPHGPCPSSPSGHTGAAGFAEVIPRDGVSRALHRALGPVVSRFVPLHAQVAGDPS